MSFDNKSEITLVDSAAAATVTRTWVLDSDDPTSCSLYRMPVTSGSKPEYVVEPNSSRSKLTVKKGDRVLAVVKYGMLKKTICLSGGEEQSLGEWMKAHSILKGSWDAIFPVEITHRNHPFTFKGDQMQKLTVMRLNSPEPIGWHTPSRKKVVTTDGKSTVEDVLGSLSLTADVGEDEVDFIILSMLIVDKKWRDNGKLSLNAGIAGARATGVTLNVSGGMGF
ncbi:hypothetical protein DL96DRAFT_1571469 [Flagelloscypha sp. PMI_526]|nr:hypothetical protein DL96DRAFT_1571469 [Flagelloscypha sp. PMI_526]